MILIFLARAVEQRILYKRYIKYYQPSFKYEILKRIMKM